MKKKILILSLAFVPVISFAATLNTVLVKVKELVALILPLLISLAVIYFVWALVKYMLKAGEEQAEARQQMIWGVIILFVMVSIWGLVGVLGDTFGVDGKAAVPALNLIPTLNP